MIMMSGGKGPATFGNYRHFIIIIIINTVAVELYN